MPIRYLRIFIAKSLQENVFQLVCVAGMLELLGGGVGIFHMDLSLGIPDQLSVCCDLTNKMPFIQ